MRDHEQEFRQVSMCRVPGVRHSGDYAWIQTGASARERKVSASLGRIQHHWLASGTVYSYRIRRHGSAHGLAPLASEQRYAQSSN